jgi:hypothetical protein
LLQIAEDPFPDLQSRRSFCSINKWYAPILNITTFKYPHEAEDMFAYERIKSRFPEMEMHLFGHSADSANRWDFYPPPRWEDKKIDTQGFGYDGRCVFPFMASPQTLITDFLCGLALQLLPHPNDHHQRPQTIRQVGDRHQVASPSGLLDFAPRGRQSPRVLPEEVAAARDTQGAQGGLCGRDEKHQDLRRTSLLLLSPVQEICEMGADPDWISSLYSSTRVSRGR